MMYRTDDGQGWVHVNFGRKGGPLPCAAPALEGDSPKVGDRCCRIRSKLCDAAVCEDLGGKKLTCDMPLCSKHATSVIGKDIDYCPRHAHLATMPLPLAEQTAGDLQNNEMPMDRRTRGRRG